VGSSLTCENQVPTTVGVIAALTVIVFKGNILSRDGRLCNHEFK
jgi:hypothetical protein